MKKVIPILLAALILFSGCGSQGKNDKGAAAAQPENNKPVYVMAGKIESGEDADITTKISGKVASVSADVGTFVKAGDPLIVLDTKDIKAQVAQAEAGVSTALANLNKTKAGARPEQAAQAKAALESAKTSFDTAQNTYNRNKDLLTSGAISQSQMEIAQTALAAARAQYDAAKNSLAILTNGETKETLNILDAQVKQSEAALAVVRVQLDKGTILSPIDGVVSAKNINPGELATPGAVLLTVVNADSFMINASLPTGLMDQVKEGQQVTIKISELPGKEFAGEIVVVNPVIDSSGKNILVKVKLEDKDPSIKPGMFAEIGLRMGQVK